MNTDTFVSTPIPPTYMGPAGTSFFAGVHYNDVFNTAPIPMDYDNPAGQSWLAWGEPLLGGDPIDLNDLANATVGIYQFSADNFLVRITGSDGTLAGDCNQNTQLDRCDILSGTSQDIDQNMVPDDVNASGTSTAVAAWALRTCSLFFHHGMAHWATSMVMATLDSLTCCCCSLRLDRAEILRIRHAICSDNAAMLLHRPRSERLQFQRHPGRHRSHPAAVDRLLSLRITQKPS